MDTSKCTKTDAAMQDINHNINGINTIGPHHAEVKAEESSARHLSLRKHPTQAPSASASVSDDDDEEDDKDEDDETHRTSMSGTSASSGQTSDEDHIPTLDLSDEEKQQAQQALPHKHGSSIYRNMRWHILSMYRRMFVVIFLINIIVPISLLATRRLGYRQCATGAAINICGGILARQEHVVNFIFILATSLPHSMPLSIRCKAAKVYTYGGFHSGCNVAGTCWYIAFTALITRDASMKRTLIPAAVLSYLTLALLLLIISFAHPSIRSKMHNQFEMTHRFAGWTVAALYWAQICLLANCQQAYTGQTFGQNLIHTPAFWCIVIITVCLIYPWLRLRNRTIRVEKLSDHATRLHFSKPTLSRCVGVRLSTSPLFETHAFASVPATAPDTGYSAIISNAGDWTKRLIQDPSPRTKIWVKGVPTKGFLQIANLFKRTVVVATGSGIGPCLSLLSGNNKVDCRVLWSTMSPLETYGKQIVDNVLAADSDAVIVDTRKTGRPDLVALAYQLYRVSGAEAVVVISNPKVTRKVVYGMESRGVPAFGPIFDS